MLGDQLEPRKNLKAIDSKYPVFLCWLPEDGRWSRRSHIFRWIHRILQKGIRPIRQSLNRSVSQSVSKSVSQSECQSVGKSVS